MNAQDLWGRLQYIPRSKESNVELEARVIVPNKKHRNKPTITQYSNILNYLRNFPQERSKIDSYIYSDNKRKRVVTDEAGNVTTSWQLKTTAREDSVIVWDWNFKWSISVETPTTPSTSPKPPLLRRIERISVPLDQYHLVADISKVKTTETVEGVGKFGGRAKTTVERTNYEIEFEYDGDESEYSLQRYVNGVHHLVLKSLGTDYHYTKEDLAELVRSVNSRLSTTTSMLYHVDRNILPNPVPLKPSCFNHPNLYDDPPGYLFYGGRYCVSHKADGHRRLLVSSYQGTWLVNPPRFYNKVSSVGVSHELTVLDCEVIHDNNSYTVWVFDAYVVDGITLAGRTYLERLSGSFNTAEEYVRRYDENKLNRLEDAGAYGDLYERLTLRYKSADLLSNHDIFDKLRLMLESPDHEYEKDGLIFTPNLPFDQYSVSPVMKWKPRELTTIDFLVKDGKLYVEEYSTGASRGHVLWKGVDLSPYRDDYTPDNIAAFNDSVVEMAPVFDGNTFTGLKVVKRRPDKENANNIHVAESNWRNIFDPITRQTLSGEDYSLVKFTHRQLKYNLYSHHLAHLAPSPHFGARSSSLLDVGAGRGNDMNKWRSYGFAKVVAVEIDPDRAKELARRVLLSPDFVLVNELGDELNAEAYLRDNFSSPEDHLEKLKKLKKSRSPTKVLSLVTSIHDHSLVVPYVKTFVPDGVDAISVMDSATFFWRDQQTLEGTAQTLLGCSKTGTVLIYKMLNGNDLRSYFQNESSFVVSDSHGEVSYSLTPRVRGGKFTGEIETYIRGWISDTEKSQDTFVEYFTDPAQLFVGLMQAKSAYYNNKKEDMLRAENVGLLPEPLEKASSFYTYGAYILTTNVMQKSVVRTTPTHSSLLSRVSPAATDSKIRLGDYTRVGVIGDGHCFFHCVLYATKQEYRTAPTAERKRLARVLRSNLASKLWERDSNTTLWEKFGDESYSTYYVDQLKTLAEVLVSGTEVENGGLFDYARDYSISGLDAHLNSNEYIGQEVMQLFVYLSGYNVLVLNPDEGTHLEQYFYYDSNQKVLIILYVGSNHYELLERDDKLIHNVQDSYVRSYDNSRTQFYVQSKRPQDTEVYEKLQKLNPAVKSMFWYLMIRSCIYKVDSEYVFSTEFNPLLATYSELLRDDIRRTIASVTADAVSSFPDLQTIVEATNLNLPSYM